MIGRKSFLKLSLITFLVGGLFFVLAFFAFHYLTASGFSTVWHAEAEKPYVTELFGDFAILNVTVAFVSFLIYFLFSENKAKK